MKVDPEATVRGWKDPEHRGDDHPAGVIVLDVWGGSTVGTVTMTCTLTPVTMLTCTMWECCAVSVVPQACELAAE
jgi:hypothetical protein